MSNKRSTDAQAKDGGDSKRQRSEAAQKVFIWGGQNCLEGEDEPVLAEELCGCVHIKEIACASGSEDLKHRMAYVLTRDGKVKQWGRSPWFEGSHKNREITTGSLMNERIIHISAGFNHFVAIDEDGALYSWGSGKHGMLGHGDEEDVLIPKRVEALSHVKIKNAVCGDEVTVALTTDGKLFTWGYNAYELGYTGHGVEEEYINQPRRLQALESKTIVQVSITNVHTAAVSDEGELFTWGHGASGQLGHGGLDDLPLPTFVEKFRGKKVKQVSCGWFHTLALTEEGQVYSFGCNARGKLGRGVEETNIYEPTLLGDFFDGSEKKVKFISCGDEHTAVVTDSEEIYTCGSNEYGQLGNGTRADNIGFRLVEKLKNLKIDQIACTAYHTVIVATPNFSGLDSVPVVSSLRNMVNNEDCADVVFVVEDQKVYGHRAFLTQRSEFFRSMFNSGMRESAVREIPLSDITKTILLLVLEYLCTGEVVVPIEAVVDLHVAAGRYFLERLLEICCNSLSRHLTLVNATGLLVDTHNAGAQDLCEICLKFVVKNLKVISETAGMAEVVKHDALALRLVRKTAEQYC